MTTPVRHLLAFALAALLPLAASAQAARTAKPVNLRAGPARDYPLVTRYGPGAPIAVQGCTSGYGWCDVIGPDGARGWLYAANIVYPYQNRDVPVLGYGAVIGLPIVGFAIGSYWGSYYRDRPWFGNRARWEHRPGFRPGGPAFRPQPHGGPGRPALRPPMAGRPPGGDPHRGGGGPGRMPGGGGRGGPGFGGHGGAAGGHGGFGGGHVGGGGHGGGGGGHHR